MEVADDHVGAGLQWRRLQLKATFKSSISYFAFKRRKSLNVPESKRGVKCCEPGVNVQLPTGRDVEVAGQGVGVQRAGGRAAGAAP